MSAISQSELWHAANKSTATMQSHRLHKSIHTIFPSALIAAAMLIVAVSCITVSAQPPGGDDLRWDRGAVGPGGDVSVLPVHPLFERDDIGATQRNCADTTSNCAAHLLPPNDFARMDFGTASIGTPLNTTTEPTFMENCFDCFDDALSSPGVFYHTVNASSFTKINHLKQLVNNDPAGVSATVPGPFGRYLGGSMSSAGGVIGGSLLDNKAGTPTPGASVALGTFEESYVINAAGVPFVFSGALAFNAVLPKASTGLPGAAAVSLSTKMSLSVGTLITNEDTGNAFDGNCTFLGSIVASVSEGISDGNDATANSGLDENFFGNADVGAVVAADPSFPIQGTVNISSTTVNSGNSESYKVAGSWDTPSMSFGSFTSQPIIVTFSHTLTMIADPGAEVTLAPLTTSDLASLPHSNGIFVITTGAVIPEPTSLVLLCLASCMMLVPGRRRA